MSSAAPSRTHEWTGASGDIWVLHQQRLDLMLAAFGDAAIAAATLAMVATSSSSAKSPEGI